MDKFEDISTSSTTASFPTSGVRSTPSRKLWVEYHECGCTFDFKKKYFGLTHWWKFTRLRYWYRKWYTIFKHRVGLTTISTKGGEYGDSTKGGGYGDLWPILMTNEEYDHWFKDE